MKPRITARFLYKVIFLDKADDCNKVKIVVRVVKIKLAIDYNIVIFAR